MAMTSEDSHASWYAVGMRGQQREGVTWAIFEGCSPRRKHPLMPDLPVIDLDS
jgi:hypothetical protein